jgi:restriction system protein
MRASPAGDSLITADALRHGNFGSRDGDPPAGWRYTDVRLSPAGQVALAAERGELAPVPVGLITGTTYQFGTRPPFRPAAAAQGPVGLDGSTAERTIREDLSPREAIEDVIDSAHSAVAADLLARTIMESPAFLEQLVLRLLVKMGYGGLEVPTEHLGGPGDAGLDGLIRLDPLGLDVVYVQAKRYTDRHVGRPDIRAFVGALHGAQASRGVFITTSRFSAEARDYADRVNARIVLVDGPELAALMIEHDCGVIVEESFVLKQVDENFFEDT